MASPGSLASQFPLHVGAVGARVISRWPFRLSIDPREGDIWVDAERRETLVIVAVSGFRVSFQLYRPGTELTLVTGRISRAGFRADACAGYLIYRASYASAGDQRRAAFAALEAVSVQVVESTTSLASLTRARRELAFDVCGSLGSARGLSGHRRLSPALHYRLSAARVRMRSSAHERVGRCDLTGPASVWIDESGGVWVAKLERERSRIRWSLARMQAGELECGSGITCFLRRARRLGLCFHACFGESDEATFEAGRLLAPPHLGE